MEIHEHLGRSQAWYGSDGALWRCIPADVHKLADEVKQSIMDNSFHPFQGPIENQKDELVVKEGEVDLASLSWYVEGVEGSIPK